MILTGFSVDELERWALCAPPEMAAAAQRVLDERGPEEVERLKEISRLEDEIKEAENYVLRAHAAVDDAEDELIALRKQLKELRE